MTGIQTFAGRKVVAEGATFQILKYNKEKVKRASLAADPRLFSSSLYVPSSMSDATMFQFVQRRMSETNLFMYAKFMKELGLFSKNRNPVFSDTGALVQSITSTQLKITMPSWMPVMDGKPTLELAHHAHCQVLVDAQPLQSYVPSHALGIKALITNEFGQVGIASRMHNYVDSSTDKILIQKFIGMLNAIGSTEAPLTLEQIVAAMQYMQRSQRLALKRTQERIEKALTSKEGSEEEWSIRRDIVKETVKLNEDAVVPDGLNAGLIAFKRWQMHDALKSNL